MKKLLFLLFISFISCTAGGQSREDIVSAVADRERERINAERVRLEAGFDAEETACHKKFFVNHCLNAIKSRRHEAMAQLRQQEVALNDAQRKQKAAEQIRKTEEKSSLDVQQQAAERRAKSLEEQKAREERSRKKTDDRIHLEQDATLNAADAANKMKGAQEKAQARLDKQAAIAQEVQKYNEKQQEVMQRKADREKKQREQTKPAAKPLPTPDRLPVNPGLRP